MQIFNTMTRQKEEFVPQKEGEYRIYVCGPTVYNYIHIGNARPMIVFDTLRRYLEYCGNKVYYVSNITDIDDKLIKKADGNIITKIRYEIPEKDNLTIELDIFEGRFAGLLLAEVEFSSEAEALSYTPPEWFGKDVTNDAAYHNSNMAGRA